MRATDAIEKLKTYPQDEEVFVLRGRDLTADAVIFDWVRRNGMINKELPIEKLNEAIDCAKRMRNTPGRRFAD